MQKTQLPWTAWELMAELPELVLGPVIDKFSLCWEHTYRQRGIKRIISRKAEAEDALLVLSTYLTWKPGADYNSVRAITGTAEYVVTWVRAQCLLREYMVWYRTKLEVEWPPFEVSPHRYKRQADAKAACERHYAIGKWE